MVPFSAASSDLQSISSSSQDIKTSSKEKKKKTKLQLKAPTQERSKQTVNTLINSCSQILRTEGFFGVTTDKVAKLAGISIGSLYQFFGNKESVVSAVIQNALEKDMSLFASKIVDVKALSIQDRKEVILKLMIEIFENDIELKNKMIPIQNYLLEPTWINNYIDFFVKNISKTLDMDKNPQAQIRISIFVSSFFGLIQNSIQQNKKISTDPEYLKQVSELYIHYI
jgi:AcrR family transcriptional regulator